MYKYNTMNIAETTYYEKINIYKLDYILKDQSNTKKSLKNRKRIWEELINIITLMPYSKKNKENLFIPPEYKDTEFGLIQINYKKR